MTELPPPPSRAKASPWPFVGMIGMACVLFLIGASVLATPWFVVLGLTILWLVVLVVAVVWWSLHPTWLPWLPVGLDRRVDRSSCRRCCDVRLDGRVLR